MGTLAEDLYSRSGDIEYSNEVASNMLHIALQHFVKGSQHHHEYPSSVPKETPRAQVVNIYF